MTGSRRPERGNRLNHSRERRHLHPWWGWQEMRGQPRCAGARTRMAFLQGNGVSHRPVSVHPSVNRAAQPERLCCASSPAILPARPASLTNI